MKPSKLFVLDGRTATPHFPGIGRYVRSLARELPGVMQDGERLAVILNPEQSYLTRELEAAGEVTLLPSRGSPFSLQQQWQVPRALGRSGAGLYHSPYYLMPYRPGVTSILTAYDLIPLRYPETVSPQARLFFRWTTSLALRSVSNVIAISQSTSADLQRYFSLSPERITVISLAAGPQFKPQSREETERIRRVYGLSCPYILYFGINKPHKNLDRLVQAVPLMAPAGGSPAKTFELVVAGAWDPRYPKARDRADQLGILDRVRFLGPIPEADLPGLYAGAAALVFPSLYEGFGLPVLEAMACGTPVACSSASSLAELAAGAALLFDPLSLQSIGETIQTLLADPSLQDDLRQRGFQRAAGFSWQRTAEATLRVYSLAMTGR